MKKYTILTLVLVLTALTLTGCRNPGKDMAPTTVPTTYATTEPMTMPSTEATQPAVTTTPATEQTVPTTITGEDASENTNPGGSTDATEATNEGRARRTPASR